MEKMISMTLAALLVLPVLAGPPGKGHAPARHAPPPAWHHPVMRAAPHHHHGPWRPMPPPPPPRFEPVVAGVLGLRSVWFAPRYVWVEGHYESRMTALPNGTVATTLVWIPGQYVQVR